MSETTVTNQPRSAEPDYDAIAAQLLADIEELEKRIDEHSEVSDRNLVAIRENQDRIDRNLSDLRVVMGRLMGAYR